MGRWGVMTCLHSMEKFWVQKITWNYLPWAQWHIQTISFIKIYDKKRQCNKMQLYHDDQPACLNLPDDTDMLRLLAFNEYEEFIRLCWFIEDKRLLSPSIAHWSLASEEVISILNVACLLPRFPFDPFFCRRFGCVRSIFSGILLAVESDGPAPWNLRMRLLCTNSILERIFEPRTVVGTRLDNWEFFELLLFQLLGSYSTNIEKKKRNRE